jgi:hypothetical protein
MGTIEVSAGDFGNRSAFALARLEAAAYFERQAGRL